AGAGVAAIALDLGTIELHGGLLAAPFVGLAGGVLTGEGTVEGDLANEGRVAPGIGAGALVVTDDYVQQAAGVLEITLGGTKPGDEHAVLEVLGTSFLEGTLEVVLESGYTPQLGDAFEVLRYGARFGTFDNHVGFDLGGGLSLIADYQPDALWLRTVPEPGTATLVILGMVGL